MRLFLLVAYILSISCESKKEPDISQEKLNSIEYYSPIFEFSPIVMQPCDGISMVPGELKRCVHSLTLEPLDRSLCENLPWLDYMRPSYEQQSPYGARIYQIRDEYGVMLGTIEVICNSGQSKNEAIAMGQYNLYCDTNEAYENGSTCTKYTYTPVFATPPAYGPACEGTLSKNKELILCRKNVPAYGFVDAELFRCLGFSESYTSVSAAGSATTSVANASGGSLTVHCNEGESLVEAVSRGSCSGSCNPGFTLSGCSCVPM